MQIPRTVPGRVPLLLFFALFILTAPIARAQDVRTITFEEAVRIALDQNTTLLQAENDVEADARLVFQRRMDFLPSLSFNTRGTRGSGFTQDQAGRNIAFTSNNVNGEFSTQLNVFNGFADVASLEQAKHNREASSYVYDRERQNVVFNVVDNYLDYVNARELVNIQQENLEAQRQQLSQIEEFVNVGARPISDLYQQQAETAQAELQVLDAQRGAELAKTRLIQVLELEPFGNYEFVAPPADELTLEAREYNLEELIRVAFEQRNEISAQRERIESARQGIRIARSLYWPSVNIGGSYRSNFSPDDERGLFNQLDLNRGNNIGFSISFPIFDRFNRGTQVQQAQVNYENATLELQNIRQQVALQVRQAYLDYAMAEKRVDVTETQVRAAEQAVNAAEERYNVGAGTLVELTQARARYVEAVSNQAQAKYDFVFQGKLIDYFVGRLNPGEPLLER